MEKKNKMKKIFKNLFIFSLICVFSSCEFFNAPVKDFFMDNTEAASIGLFEFSSETYKNPITEKLTVSSLQDANVVLYLRNPQEYNFITSENMTSTFGSFLQSEYYLVQDENDKNILNLTIPKELLEKTEIESRNNEYNKSQSFLINLFHPVSKAEFLPFTLEFDCDTIPPAVFSPVYYITTSSYPNSSMQNNYVIAFNMPKKSETNSEKIHNDLSKLVINEKEYSISIADDGTMSFPNNPEIIAGDVNSVVGFAPINSLFVVENDYQPFYIITDEKLSINGSESSFSIYDKGNFFSKSIISSESRKLGDSKIIANGITYETSNQKILVNQNLNDTLATITIVPPDISLDLKDTIEAVTDVNLKYTLKNAKTHEVIESGTNDGKGNVTIEIPSGTYSLECVAHKDYYADSFVTFQEIVINTINLCVSEEGNDVTGDGSDSNPFATIQKAQTMFTDISSEENTICLLSDIKENLTLPQNSNLTIDGNNQTYTITTQNIENNGSRLALKNLIFDSEDSCNIKGTGQTVFDNITLNATTNVYGNLSVLSVSAISQNQAKLIMENGGSLTLGGKFEGTIQLKENDSANPTELNKIICNGSLEGSSIKLELPVNNEGKLIVKPTIEVPLEFIQGYELYNTADPKDYFVNDLYPIGLVDGKPAFVSGDGNFEIEAIPSVQILLNGNRSSENIILSEPLTVLITAKLDGKNIDFDSSNITVYNHGSIAPELTKTGNTYTIPNGWPKDEIYQFVVSVVYEGITYTETFTVYFENEL